MMDAVVPQPEYAEFSCGLAKIGSWRVEAQRSPLPYADPTIRVNG